MTREEAIEMLEKLCDVYPLLKPAFNMAISALREQEDHFREATKKVGHKWISVEERLPGEDGIYLVYGPSICTDIKWYDQRSLAQYFWKHEVTHWMPLPEPHTEEEV